MDADQNEASLTSITMGKTDTAVKRQTAKTTYDQILLQSGRYPISRYPAQWTQTRRLSVERHDLITKERMNHEA